MRGKRVGLPPKSIGSWVRPAGAGRHAARPGLLAARVVARAYERAPTDRRGGVLMGLEAIARAESPRAASSWCMSRGACERVRERSGQSNHDLALSIIPLAVAGCHRGGMQLNGRPVIVSGGVRGIAAATAREAL